MSEVCGTLLALVRSQLMGHGPCAVLETVNACHSWSAAHRSPLLQPSATLMGATTSNWWTLFRC